MPLDIATEIEFDLEDLKYEIEESRATDRWNDAPDNVKDIFHELEWNIIDGEFSETTSFINPLLELDVAARTLISGPMSTGIAEVGRRFKMDEYFLPEVMMSAKCMQAALAIIKPLIIAEKGESVGTCVIGTIQGDLHDIGKNIVSMMLEAAGFEVETIALIPRPTVLPGEMEAWLETFCEAFLHAMPDEDRPAILSEVTQAVRPALFEPEGRWVADYVRLRFLARKPEAA